MQLWDVGGGRVAVALAPAHAGGASSVAFRPDGAPPATGGRADAARVWDAAAGRGAATLVGHADWVLAVTYAGDAAALVVVLRAAGAGGLAAELAILQ